MKRNGLSLRRRTKIALRDPDQLIVKSMKCCGLNLKSDGSEDDYIHCFKSGQPCENAAETLRSQQKRLSEPDFNPFEYETTDSDIDEAAPAVIIVENSDHGDEDIAFNCFYILILYSIFIVYIVYAKTYDKLSLFLD